MALQLHTLTHHRKAKHRKKRIGRGNASGHGTFSTRGQKGQRARAGGAGGLKRRGLKQMLRNKPKLGGFKSRWTKFATVDIAQIERHFATGEVIDGKKLIAKNLIKTDRPGLKVLGSAPVTKALTVIADSFSDGAREALTKAGGAAQLKVKVMKKPTAKSTKAKTKK